MVEPDESAQRGGRILVVEDERIVALDLAATLGELGYEVVGTVASGEAAIEKARLLTPDLILMDIRLAGVLDGIQAAATIRGERDVPVIYLTAHTDDETLRRAKSTEPMAYLVKPFRAAELRCAIEIALHRHEISARLRTREEHLTATLQTIANGLAAAGVGPDPALAGTDVALLNADLEQRVLNRVEELERANRELEQFSSSVAHDLRAPLHWIDGFSQILIEDHAANLGGEGLGHLQRIRGAVGRMSQVIEDLLQLARIARTELDQQPVDLAQLARNVVGELRRVDTDRRVELVVPDELVVQADAKLLRIALQNLLGNAWKFTSKTAASRIELGHAAAGGGEVCFIRDNGAGFDMAYAHRLFGAFQRLHTSGEFEGTGLGLAIVQRAIARLGGRIWAESEVGQGATFYFTVAP